MEKPVAKKVQKADNDESIFGLMNKAQAPVSDMNLPMSSGNAKKPPVASAKPPVGV